MQSNVPKGRPGASSICASKSVSAEKICGGIWYLFVIHKPAEAVTQVIFIVMG
jgi:hypothetical protein